jgi:predicted XRE-type DNA-binding protein
MPKRESLKREPSTGNVFADLGLPNAGEHLTKAGLVVRIDRTIRQRKLTQSAAAQLMGIDQPKISALLAGQFRGHSVERLMRFLVALGLDIVVKPRKRGTAELRVA